MTNPTAMPANAIPLNFDASQVAPFEGFQPLPAGEYSVTITEAQIMPAKENPQNRYLQLQYTVSDAGPFAGRKLIDRLNLWNDNPTATDMAQKTLSAIARASGVIRVQTPQDLFGRPFKVQVSVRPAQGDFGEQNRIMKYISLTGQDLKTIGGMPGAPAGAPCQPSPWQQPGAPVQQAPGAGYPPQQQAPAYPPQAAPPAYQPPAAPVAPPAAPVAQAQHVMTPAANGVPYESYRANNWTDEQMIQHGLMYPPQPVAAPAPVAPPAAPAAPQAPGAGYPPPGMPAQPWTPPGAPGAPPAGYGGAPVAPGAPAAPIPAMPAVQGGAMPWAAR
jgi:hypothetical protein